MTTKQKRILLNLLNGGFIGGSSKRIILFDRRRIPLIRLHQKTFDAIKTILKKTGARWVLSVAAVRRQRKNSFAKKLYLKTFNEKKLFNDI